jgi:hypothetical protein
VSWAGWISLQDKHIALISMSIRSCAVWVALVILDQFSTVKTLSFDALIFLWGVVSVFFCHQCFKWIFFVFSVCKYTSNAVAYLFLGYIRQFKSCRWWILSTINQYLGTGSDP